MLISLTCNSKTIDADSLVVRFMSWNMDGSPHSITCLNYEYDVPYKEFTITDRMKIESLGSAIKSASRVKNTEFNVGCKLFFVKDDMVVEEVCMDKDYTLRRGKMYLSSTEVKNIIDGIMETESLNTDKFHYMPDRYGNEYVYGRDSLFRYFDSNMCRIAKTMRLTDDVIIVTHIEAEKSGKTAKIIDMKIYSKGLDENGKTRIEEEIRHILMRKIRWKKNLNRKKSDTISINYKYVHQNCIVDVVVQNEMLFTGK